MMKRDARRLRFRWVRPRGPQAMQVNPKTPPPEAQPGAPKVGQQSPQFVPDGMIFPRPDVTFFDVGVREPSLQVNATSTQTAFTQEELIKGGWIRGIGYEFNNPHGYFQVRTTILINGAPPAKYIFKTVDAGAPETYQGSFPTSQIGTIEQPTSVFIALPSNALVQVRFVNASTTEPFEATVRLTGWNFGN